MRTFNLGILRTIRGSLKRFVALAIICALGTAMLVGLTVACKDLRYSADAFYDSQELYDIRVVSTLGFDDDDIEALAAIEGVEAAEGGYTETVYTTVGSSSEKVDVYALSVSGRNAPYLLEGHLPVTDDQIVVTRAFLAASGLSIGDTVTFHSESDATGDEDDDSTVFERKEYTIVGTVLDCMDINNAEGTMTFRSTGGAQYAFYVLPSCVTAEAYTVAYLWVDGAAELMCYSDEYEDLIGQVKERVEEVREELAAARTAAVVDAANEEIDDAEAEAMEEIDDAQAEIDDAQAELDDGAAELADGWSEYYSSRAEALSELADAQAEIDAGYAELSDAEALLVENAATIADALAQVEDGLEQIADAEVELAAARAQLETAASMLTMFGILPEEEWNELAATTDPDEAAELAEAINEEVEPTVEETVETLEEMLELVDELAALAAADSTTDTADTDTDTDTTTGTTTTDIADSLSELLDGLDDETLADGLSDLVDQLPDDLQGEFADLEELDIDELRALIESLIEMMDEATELAPGMAEVIAAEAELAATKAELEETRETLLAAQEEIADAWIELSYNEGVLEASEEALETSAESALEQLDEAEETLQESEQELADGRAELDDAQSELDEALADALAEIADARAEVGDIEDAVWYIQDRTSISSYSSVDSDAGSIEAIGQVIPLIFVIVAVLISLTTMTRMVDEERTLIGLYKALGYRQGRIMSKYALYAVAAVLAGVGTGYLLGFIVLPLILFYIFSIMYALPSFQLCFSLFYAVAALGIFGLCIVGATVLSARQTLTEQPADLMRPKAPKAGQRILLERVTPLWRRLSFLNKVTARNLFRYKRRMLMTVIGIAGTTALLVVGFGVRDTVIALDEWQYGEDGLNEYDLMVVTAADDLDDVAVELAEVDQVSGLIAVYTDSVTVKYGGESVSAQLIVVPDGSSLEGYIGLLAWGSGEALDLAETTAAASSGDGGAVALITANAAQVLGFSEGDTVSAQDSTMAEGSFEVAEIVETYLGNTIFMTEEAYKAAYGEATELNCLLVTLTGTAEEQVALSEELTLDSRYLSVTSTQQLYDDFSDSVLLINMVVWIIIVFAAALSFTVVFTLSNTNISEREREIATIKVLGFRYPEVHTYINKETIILTALGILVGLPLGYAVTASLEWVLKMPALYFAVTIEPVSYGISAAIAVVFTFVINQMTNRSLDRISMVEALKSAE